LYNHSYTHATYPKAGTGSSHNAFLFGLAPKGVYQAIFFTKDTGGLLHHLFTLAYTGGLFSVALSLGLLPAAVNCPSALRSPDFPHLSTRLPLIP